MPIDKKNLLLGGFLLLHFFMFVYSGFVQVGSLVTDAIEIVKKCF